MFLYFYLIIFNVTILIPSRDRAICVPQHKNWNFLLLKIDYESFNSQEIFSNLSLT